MPDDPLLTQHFRLSEFLLSQTAVRHGLDNTPGAQAMDNLRLVLAPGMQRIRGLLRVPVLISSGYRSPAVNRAVGGSRSSQHMDGLAADFTASAFGSPRDVCRRLLAHLTMLGVDQLILEGDAWVHVGFAPAGRPPRGEVLTARFGAAGVSYSRGLG